MFATTNCWSKDRLSSELERYRNKEKEVVNKRSEYDRNARILNTNANYFQKRLDEIKSVERRKNFVLKKEHLLLLKNLNIDYESGYIFVDTKRPLGYSHELAGACDALGIDHNSEEFTMEDEREVWQLVSEMPLAFEATLDHMLRNLDGI